MKKNKEIKYNHVGRPTNEEKKKYKKKKTLKIIGIISCIFIVVGGILLYINKDNLVMSGIMGNSVTNTMKSIQNNPNYKNTLVFKADAYDGKYLYQRYAESGNKKLVTFIYHALGFKDAKKYKAKAIRFYYNGKLLGNDLAYAKGAYIRLSKSAYGKSLSAIVYAQNLKTKKLEYKPIRIVVEKTGPFLGTKYKISNSQLKIMAYVAYNKTKTIRGAIFEAALIANRYELYGNNYNDIYEYFIKSNYWKDSFNTQNLTKENEDKLIQGVKYVLANGYRPMPQYIDESRCVKCGEVSKLGINGSIITDRDSILNKKNYISNKTVIISTNNIIYNFYSFPVSGKYAYGYTNEALKKYNIINKISNPNKYKIVRSGNYKYPLYNDQYSEKYYYLTYGDSTMHEAGCGVFSSAMLIAGLTNNLNVTPESHLNQIKKYFPDYSYYYISGEGSSYPEGIWESDFLESVYGIKSTYYPGYDYTNAFKHLQNGYPIIAGRPGHMLAVIPPINSKSSTAFYVLDSIGKSTGEYSSIQDYNEKNDTDLNFFFLLEPIK